MRNVFERNTKQKHLEVLKKSLNAKTVYHRGIKQLLNDATKKREIEVLFKNRYAWVE